MICAIVICALLVGGGPQQCDISVPAQIKDHPEIRNWKSCRDAFARARASQADGQRPIRFEMIPPPGWTRKPDPEEQPDG